MSTGENRRFQVVASTAPDTSIGDTLCPKIMLGIHHYTQQNTLIIFNIHQNTQPISRLVANTSVRNSKTTLNMVNASE